jgi:hypothetical protein
MAPARILHRGVRSGDRRSDESHFETEWGRHGFRKLFPAQKL